MLTTRRTYTFSEIEQLAHEFADDGERSEAGKVHVQATMLQFVEWVKEREKEG